MIVLGVLVGNKHVIYVVRCAIWYYLYNLTNVKNTHGGMLILVKLQAEAKFTIVTKERYCRIKMCLNQ